MVNSVLFVVDSVLMVELVVLDEFKKLVDVVLIRVVNGLNVVFTFE